MVVPVTLSALARAVVIFLAVVIVVNWRRRAHPHQTFGPAIQITLARAFLVALAAGLIGEASRSEAAAGIVVLGTVAIALDGLDGWVARRTQMTSAFGARFDMEIDALLILVLAILTWQYRKAGPWVLASGLFRYVFVAAGWIWPWLNRPLTPTFRAKAICVLQIVALLLALVPALMPPASDLVAAAGLMALTYSFAADSVRLWHLR